MTSTGGSSERARTIARYRLWIGTAFAAVLLRFVYFLQHAQSPFFSVPILDEAFYDSVARALLDGRPVDTVNPAFRPMFYPALLAQIYRLFAGWEHPATLAIQHLLGVATTVLVAELGRRAFRSITAGAGAAGLFLLAGPPVYFESQLLNTALFTFLVTAFLALVTWPRRLGALGIGIWALSGLLLGLAAQARPNVLPVLAAIPLLALWNPWAESIKRRVAAVLTLYAGTFLVLAVAGLWHAQFFKAFHLMPTSGGINFYLGNKEGADGMIPRQDSHATYGDRYKDSVQVFSENVYIEETGAERPLDPRAVSSFWYGKTLREAGQDPLRFSGLLARKLILLLWDHEIPNNKSYAFFAQNEAPLLHRLPVTFAWLLSLAAVGLWAGRRGSADPATLATLILFILTYGAGILLFFVTARYRLPLWPALAALAGGGAASLLQAGFARFRKSAGDSSGNIFRSGLPSPSPWICLLAVGLFIFSKVNWLVVQPETPYRDHFFRSLAHQHKGDLDAAQADAKRAVELEPSDPAAQFQLGTLALLQEDLGTATRHLSIATRLLPTEPRVLNNLGIVLERRKQYSRAFLAYVKATENGPSYSPAWVNLALMELRAGETQRAERKIRRAEKLGDRSVNLQCARAFLEIKKGHIEIGRAILAGAMKRDQELTQRLVDEHRRPLTLEKTRRGRQPS